MGVFIFNSFALIDIAIVRLFLRWQHTYEQRTNEWIDSLNLFDALVSMGNFRLNKDRAVQAEISEENKVVYEAKKSLSSVPWREGCCKRLHNPRP